MFVNGNMKGGLTSWQKLATEEIRGKQKTDRQAIFWRSDQVFVLVDRDDLRGQIWTDTWL